MGVCMIFFLCALFPNFIFPNFTVRIITFRVWLGQESRALAQSRRLIKVTTRVLTLCKLVFLNRWSVDHRYQTHLATLFFFFNLKFLSHIPESLGVDNGRGWQSRICIFKYSMGSLSIHYCLEHTDKIKSSWIDSGQTGPPGPINVYYKKQST